MSNSCVFCPKAKNKKTGEEVPSKLFMGLLEYSSNDRQFAKENYVLGTSDEFREQFGDQVKYDENDEPTIDSFLKLTEKEVNKKKRIDSLNKQLGSGTYSYTEADNKRQSFENQVNEDVNEEYTTVMTPEDNHQCRVGVGENTQANRATTRDTLASKSLFDRIKAAVQALGGDITFIDEQFSRYTTENAQKLANGLYAVIQLAKGGNLTVEAAHEAGHFAVGALGNQNPLIQRLANALNNEQAMMELLGEEFETVRYSKNPQREAMGLLVGKYIADEVDKKSLPNRLMDRIINKVKKMFYSLSGDTVSRMKLDAKETAEQIASNFLSQKNAGSVENALETKETLFNVVDDGATKIFKNIIRDMSLMAKQIGAFDKSMEKEVNALIASIADGRIVSNGSPLQAAMSASGILDAIDELNNQIPTIQGLLDSVSYDMDELTQSATNLRTVSIFVKQLDAILAQTNNLISNTSVSGIDQYKIPIQQLRDALNKSKVHLEDRLRTKEKRLFLSFLKEAYGKDYIERAARMVFKHGRLVHVDGERIDVDEAFLEAANYEGDWIEWITSASNSSDLVNQIVYKAAQAYTTQANMNTMRVLEDLRELRQFCDDNDVDTEQLFERYTEDVYAEDENGNLQLIHKAGEITGNYITELDWGRWEEEYRAFRQKIKRDFEASDPNNKTLLKQVYDVRLAAYAKKKVNDWHRQHSYYNTNTGQYEPLGYQKPGHPNAGMYKNSEYDNLSDEAKQVAQKFLDIKAEHDNFLTQRTRKQGEAFAVFVSPVRMPQFRGRINDETVAVAKESKKFLPKAYASVVVKRLIGAFTHQANDRDYGNENTNQTLNDDIFSKDYQHDLGDIRRVATYGINKFSDMNELTHDLFAGMLQYSAMANTYNTQYQMTNVLEVGSDVLMERSVATTQQEKNRKSHSLIFKRYEDFLNSQIYNLYNNSKHDKALGGIIAVDKAIGTLNGFMSQLYLAGNIGGAAVNTGTGMVEIFKEAVAGSLYNIGDMLWADKQFAKYAPSFWLKQMGKEDKTDKMSLFLQTFDAGNRFDEKVHGYSTKASRAWNLNPFGHNKMVLYSSGDYYMQAISYLASSRHIKIKLKDGTTCSLWDALETRPKDPNNPHSPIVLRYKDNVESREVNGQDMHVYIDKDGNERIWEVDGQSEYQDACRETNNRMHGVYNRMDKTMIHSTLIGKMLNTMKGYIYGYLARKAMSERYSIALGRESEGEWNTMFKTFMGIFVGDYGFKQGFKTFAYSTLMPLGKRQERIIRASGYSVEQYRNMRRTWFTHAFILATSLIVFATAKAVGLGGGDDDDDKPKYSEEEKKALRKRYKELGYSPQIIATLLGETKSYTRQLVKNQYKQLGYSDEVVNSLMKSYDESKKSKASQNILLGLFGYYFAGRLNAEQAAYTTLLGMNLERQSALNFTPLGVSALVEAYTLFEDLMTQDEVKRGSYKGMKKWEKDIISKTPYIRSWPIFDNPYEAYDNWEYGRRMGR